MREEKILKAIIINCLVIIAISLVSLCLLGLVRVP